MFSFSYNATDRNGDLNEGTIEAESVAAAVAQLEQQGLTLLSIQVVGPAIPPPEVAAAPDLRPDAGRSDDPLSHPELVRRVEGLLVRREQVLPLLRGLAEELPPGAKRHQLQEMAEQLLAATGPDDLLRTKHFAQTWLPVLAGQTAGTAAIDLERIVSEVLETSEIRRQQVRSYFYPVLVALLAFGVFAFCSMLLIPAFVEIYNDFDMNLPDLTVFVVNLSLGLIQQPLWFFAQLLLVAALVYAVYRVLRMSTIIRNFVGGLTRGSSRQLIAMANFLRTLAEARELGLQAPAALRLAGDSTRYDWIREESHYLADALEAESSASVPSLTSFPSPVLCALRPGISQQASVSLLKSVAEIYSERVRRRFDWATGFAPQVAILFVGLTVALIVVAIYLPLVSLINGLTG